MTWPKVIFLAVWLSIPFYVVAVKLDELIGFWA